MPTGCYKPAVMKLIELLSGKAQNGGSPIDPGDTDASGGKPPSKASIKGMWKKAFKSLKTKETKSSSNERRTTSECESTGSAASTPVSDVDKATYKRMISTCMSDSGVNPAAMNQKQFATPPLRRTQSDIQYLKRPLSGSSSFSNFISRTSRQSSVKKGFFRKDSKESPREEPETPEDGDAATIDPVYSLLKCAADRSRSSTTTTPGGGTKHAHACCPRASNQSNSDNNVGGGGVRGNNNSRSSSPSSDYFSGVEDTILPCSCPCHTPQVLEDYHRPILQAFKYYLPKIDKT